MGEDKNIILLSKRDDIRKKVLSSLDNFFVVDFNSPSEAKNLIEERGAVLVVWDSPNDLYSEDKEFEEFISSKESLDLVVISDQDLPQGFLDQKEFDLVSSEFSQEDLQNKARQALR